MFDIDPSEARDEIRACIDYRRQTMKDTTKRLLAALRLSVNSGPVYHWQDGEPQLWGCVDPDRPHRVFRFAKVLDSVAARLAAEEIDAPITMAVCIGEDDEGEPVDEDVVIADRAEVLRLLCGAELARML